MVAMHGSPAARQKALGVCRKGYNHERCEHCQTSAFLCLTDPACVAGDCLCGLHSLTLPMDYMTLTLEKILPLLWIGSDNQIVIP